MKPKKITQFEPHKIEMIACTNHCIIKLSNQSIITYGEWQYAQRGSVNYQNLEVSRVELPDDSAEIMLMKAFMNSIFVLTRSNKNEYHLYGAGGNEFCMYNNFYTDKSDRISGDAKSKLRFQEIQPVPAKDLIAFSFSFHALAITRSNSFIGWGNNVFRALFVTELPGLSSPVELDVPEWLKKLQIEELYNGDFHSVIVTNERKLIAFGANSNGQLGCGTISSYSAPCYVDLSRLGASPIHQVSIGGYHGVILTKDSKYVVYSIR